MLCFAEVVSVTSVHTFNASIFTSLRVQHCLHKSNSPPIWPSLCVKDTDGTLFCDVYLQRQLL